MKLGLGLFGSGATFRMASLFAGGEDGIVIDRLNPSSGNLFQDAAGTTPVTAAGQPVGLVLDQSQGLALGPELVTNGGFDADSGWTKGTGWTISGGVASSDGSQTAVSDVEQPISFVSGRTYIITLSVTRSAGVLYPKIGDTTGTGISSSGTFTLYIVSGSGPNLEIRADPNFVGSVDNISVREIPGNHVTQSVNDDYRPTLMQDTNGVYYLDHDEIDDELTVTLPNLGSSCTVAYVNEAQITLLENQTISGAYTLPETGLRGFLLIDRALTLAEQIRVIRYFARLVPGVSYAGVNSRIALICMNAVDVAIGELSPEAAAYFAEGGPTSTLSWYTETLNTATRGATRPLPNPHLVVAEADKVTIYDGDDPDLPMWDVPLSGSSNISSVSAINGKVYIGRSSSGADKLLDYANDTVYQSYSNPIFNGYLPFNIASATANLTGTISQADANVLGNPTTNDVAMTVLPGAPTDPATGLPVPTIAVATDGGVSVIKDGGDVWDSVATAVAAVDFMDNMLSYVRLDEVRSIDVTSISSDGFTYDNRYNTGPTVSGTFYPQPFNGSNYPTPISDCWAYRSSNGVSLLAEDTANSQQGRLAYITKDFNTGWMPGNIKGCWLSSTDATSLVGGTDADRSVNGIALNVNGTILRSPVAEGAELVGYSGFSASNYLGATHASFADTLYALGWEKVSGVWTFVHGVVSAAPIDGLTITGTTLKIEGTRDKALIRLSATTPSAAQLAKIEADESPLFQARAACTLYGASDAVTALAYDEGTELLHVGTSSGRSVFRGLERTSNTTAAVTKTISAHKGLILEK